MRSPNNRTITESRIGILKRRIDASLMELTEVELRINARVPPKRAGDDELASARLLLTASIVAMDAELNQLRLIQGESSACEGSAIPFAEIDHPEISRAIDVQKRREDGPVTSETERGEVVCFGGTKPNARAVTIETAPLGQPCYRPAHS